MSDYRVIRIGTGTKLHVSYEQGGAFCGKGRPGSRIVEVKGHKVTCEACLNNTPAHLIAKAEGDETKAALLKAGWTEEALAKDAELLEMAERREQRQAVADAVADGGNHIPATIYDAETPNTRTIYNDPTPGERPLPYQVMRDGNPSEVVLDSVYGSALAEGLCRKFNDKCVGVEVYHIRRKADLLKAGELVITTEPQFTQHGTFSAGAYAVVLGDEVKGSGHVHCDFAGLNIVVSVTELKRRSS